MDNDWWLWFNYLALDKVRLTGCSWANGWNTDTTLSQHPRLQRYVFGNFQRWGRWLPFFLFFSFVLCAQLFSWQAESTEERQRETEGSGWRRSWREGRSREDTQRLTGSIMRVQQSAARPSSCSSERNACLQVCVFFFRTFLLKWVWMCAIAYRHTHTPIGVCVRASVFVRDGDALRRGGRCDLWTANGATDWQFVIVAKLALVYSLLLFSNSSPLLTLMDRVSYFPATLSCCIIKCQRTVTHHLDRMYHRWQIER